MKPSQPVYVYDDNMRFIIVFESLQIASKKLEINRHTLKANIDASEQNTLKRTIKSKRIFSQGLDQYVVLKSTKLVITRRIVGL